MNKIRTIIVDDESHFIEVLRLFLQENERIEIIAETNSVAEGIKAIEEHKPDLVFLDIEMPIQNGFDLIAHFKKPTFKVVFITAYNQYAIKAIKFSALDYLLKPVGLKELNEAIERVEMQLSFEDKRIINFNNHLLDDSGLNNIMISSNKGFRKLNLDDIVSIESKPGNYSVFRTKNNTQFVCSKPLKYYDGLFSQASFYRAHRSYMINLRYFTNYEYDTGEVTLNNNYILEIAIRRRAEFVTLLREKFNY